MSPEQMRKIAAWLRACAMIPSLSPQAKAETKRTAEQCDGIAWRKALERQAGKGVRVNESGASIRRPPSHDTGSADARRPDRSRRE